MAGEVFELRNGKIAENRLKRDRGKAMDIYEVIKARRSVRAYQDRPIPDVVLNRILEAARWAPSARNLQPWKFIVVRDADLRRKLAEAASQQKFIAEAPVVIAAIGMDPDYVMSCQVPAYAVDTSIALDHLSLAAAAEGLGTCWIGAFSQEQVKEILLVPDAQKVVMLMPVGYPSDEAPAQRTRKAMDALTCTNYFA